MKEINSSMKGIPSPSNVTYEDTKTFVLGNVALDPTVITEVLTKAEEEKKRNCGRQYIS